MSSAHAFVAVLMVVSISFGTAWFWGELIPLSVPLTYGERVIMFSIIGLVMLAFTLMASDKPRIPR